MLEKKRVFAVRFALEARFLLHWVVLSIAGRAGGLQLLDIVHKNEWLEDRPGDLEKKNRDKNDCVYKSACTVLASFYITLWQRRQRVGRADSLPLLPLGAPCYCPRDHCIIKCRHITIIELN